MHFERRKRVQIKYNYPIFDYLIGIVAHHAAQLSCCTKQPSFIYTCLYPYSSSSSSTSSSSSSSSSSAKFAPNSTLIAISRRLNQHYPNHHFVGICGGNTKNHFISGVRMWNIRILTKFSLSPHNIYIYIHIYLYAEIQPPSKIYRR